MAEHHRSLESVRPAAAHLAGMSTSDLVYSTSTGQSPRGALVEESPSEFDAFVDVDPDPHCFVCRRHTDHFAEHDALVEAGLAQYTSDGSVHRTEKWDDDLARQVAEAEYREYAARLGL
ncbi:hypothetical protein GCM10027273_11830 [Nocardioides pakistanensis]